MKNLMVPITLLDGRMFQDWLASPLGHTGYGGVVNIVLSSPATSQVILWSILVPCFSHLGSLQSNLIFTDTVYIMLCVFTIVASYGLSI